MIDIRSDAMMSYGVCHLATIVFRCSALVRDASIEVDTLLELIRNDELIAPLSGDVVLLLWPRRPVHVRSVESGH